MRLATLSLYMVVFTSNVNARVAVPTDYWRGRAQGETPLAIPGGKVIHSVDVVALSKQGHTILLDVSVLPTRPDNLANGAIWLPVVHQDIPGSQWIPGAGSADFTADFDAFLRQKLRELSGDDLGKAVVVYCHPDCWLSWNASKRIIGYGYKNVYWYQGGIEGWAGSGHPLAPATPQLAGKIIGDRH